MTLNLKGARDYSGTAKFVEKSEAGDPVNVSENQEKRPFYLVFENSHAEPASRPGMSTMIVRLKPGFVASDGEDRFLITSEAGEKAVVSILVGTGEKP